MSRQLLACFLASALLAAAAAATAQPDPAYWRLDQVNTQLAAWAAQHPDLVHLTTLGQSGQGEPIPLVCLSDHAAIREPEPAVFIHAAMHANECNGTGAIMDAMARLLAGHGHDPDVTARLDGLELWFAPIVNIDGHRHVFDAPPNWADWRKTLRDNNGNGVVDFPDDGVDINRNWDWRWEAYDDDDPASQKYKGPFPWSEPETRALRDLVLVERPLLVADLHSPVTIVWHNKIFYPWSGSGGQSPDYHIARDVSEQWADATYSSGGNAYSAIYGFDTLPKEQNWVYGNTGIIALLMEIEDQCWFTGADVDTVATRVGRGLMTLMDRALAGPGIAGRVTDALTGAPLAAEVVLEELHDPDIGPRLCDEVHGQFHRLTASDSYTLRVSYRGYHEHVQAVTVDAGWATVDVALQPEVTAAPAEVEGLEFWAPSPLRAGQQVRLRLPAGSPPGRVELFDVRGRRIAALGQGLAADADHRLRLPRSLPDGVYLARVRAGDVQTTRRVVVVH